MISYHLDSSKPKIIKKNLLQSVRTWLKAYTKDFNVQNGHQELCELTNPSKYSNVEWMNIHRDLETYSYDKHVFSINGSNIYRKGWEWTQAVYGLNKLGMIDVNNSALGVGAGRECLIFWLAEHLYKVVATDLYGNETWIKQGGKEADPGIIENPQQYCPKKINKDNIEFLKMDGTNLTFEDESFDIVWSMSSIEHFGSHENSAKAIREMARVTKKRGVIAVATEYLLLPEYTHPEFFNQKEIVEYIVNASHNLELVEPINFSLPPAEYLIDSVVLPNGVDRKRRHVVLNDGNVQWTSIMIFFRKK